MRERHAVDTGQSHVPRGPMAADGMIVRGSLFSIVVADQGDGPQPPLGENVVVRDTCEYPVRFGSVPRARVVQWPAPPRQYYVLPVVRTWGWPGSSSARPSVAQSLLLVPWLAADFRMRYFSLMPWRNRLARSRRGLDSGGRRCPDSWRASCSRGPRVAMRGLAFG